MVNSKKRMKRRRRMTPQLPRVVYEEPAVTFNFTRASRVKVIKGLDKSINEEASIYCSICKHPIASRDSRIRHRLDESDEVFWRHKVCRIK
jgi:predicted DNA-binding ribbon-helix-helix protein